MGTKAFYDMCFRTLKPTTPTYSGLNHWVTAIMSEIATFLRFLGLLNADLPKMDVTWCPSPTHTFHAQLCPQTARVASTMGADGP